MDPDRIFGALASGPRRRILARLSQAEFTTTELADHFEMSAPAISRHLSVLENAGLASSQRQGQRVLYSLIRDTLADALGGFTAERSSPPLTATGTGRSRREGLRPLKPRRETGQRSGPGSLPTTARQCACPAFPFPSCTTQ